MTTVHEFLDTMNLRSRSRASRAVLAAVATDASGSWHPRALRLAATAACALALAFAAPHAHAQAAARPAPAKNLPAQKTYASPEDAAKALYDAVKSDDLRSIYAVLGPGSGAVIFSGDRVADDAMRNDLVSSWDKAMTIDRSGSDTKATLLVGPNGTPFPFPLVQGAGGWRFDAKAGAEEVINRRIGENEFSAIEVCLAYVDAQREYVLRDRDRDGVMAYAQKFLSSPGRKDGLYWPTAAGEPPSPLGPLVGAARAQGYAKGDAASKRSEGGSAFHGYRYKILTRQGKDARGGAYDYIVNGKMIGGFALVAWPARYGVSGVMTFVCNHDGVVFEKDLGSRTPERAPAMTSFNPDSTWRKTGS
ncbi:MAG: DUF2950 domain-containing protein [Burkholderiales bacterium]|nr:DUF2950 domain-containing protein [Burkholderiales bacterium]MCE7878891.1 DUF2950 domain-containing protein [Betaproteobacteria bacterium PRO3]